MGYLLERLRHKGSAGLGFGGRSFGEAWNHTFSIVGTHDFVELHVIMFFLLNHFFVGMPADFAIRLPRRVVEDFLL